MGEAVTWSSVFPRRFWGWVVFAVGALFAIFFVTEWWLIAVARDAAFVAGYPFATEPGLADGGWNYANPELYAWMSLFSAAFAAAGTTLLSLAIFRRSRRMLVGFVAVVALHQLISSSLSERPWEVRQRLREQSPTGGESQ